MPVHTHSCHGCGKGYRMCSKWQLFSMQAADWSPWSLNVATRQTDQCLTYIPSKVCNITSQYVSKYTSHTICPHKQASMIVYITINYINYVGQLAHVKAKSAMQLHLEQLVLCMNSPFLARALVLRLSLSTIRHPGLRREGLKVHRFPR